jgi:hypothetical protein
MNLLHVFNFEISFMALPEQLFKNHSIMQTLFLITFAFRDVGSVLTLEGGVNIRNLEDLISYYTKTHGPAPDPFVLTPCLRRTFSYPPIYFCVIQVDISQEGFSPKFRISACPSILAICPSHRGLLYFTTITIIHMRYV